MERPLVSAGQECDERIGALVTKNDFARGTGVVSRRECPDDFERIARIHIVVKDDLFGRAHATPAGFLPNEIAAYILPGKLCVPQPLGLATPNGMWLHRSDRPDIEPMVNSVPVDDPLVSVATFRVVPSVMMIDSTDYRRVDHGYTLGVTKKTELRPGFGASIPIADRFVGCAFGTAG